MTLAVSVKWLTLCWGSNEDLRVNTATGCGQMIRSRNMLLPNYRRDRTCSEAELKLRVSARLVERRGHSLLQRRLSPRRSICRLIPCSMKTQSATVSMLNCRYSSPPSTAGFVDYIEGALHGRARRRRPRYNPPGGAGSGSRGTEYRRGRRLNSEAR